MAQTAPLAAPPADPLDGIPLPPKEMWAELAGEDAAPATGDASAAPKPAREVAELEFVGDSPPLTTITLRYPFRWQGDVVREIVVRRLTVAQLGAFWESLPETGTFDRTDVYGLMCGLPAAVIRALPDADGTRVTAACFDFLPPALGGASA